MKREKLNCEVVYIIGILLLSLSVAMITATNFGVSMIVAPAYIISLEFPVLTFGQSEYIVQALLFIVFCILMKKVKLVYFSSFLTGIIYGAALDFWRFIIPHFNPDITPAGALPMNIRIVYFIVGMLMTSFSIALLFRTYLYPQVYDFFVKGVSEKYHFKRGKFKICFDASMLVVSCVMSLAIFHGFKGIGVGTLIMTALNGVTITAFGKLIDRCFIIEPKFEKFSKYFTII